MNISGYSLVGYTTLSSQEGAAFRAVNPATGAELEPAFYSATAADVERAANLAAQAFETYRALDGRARAAFLRRIADGLMAAQDELTERTGLEAALPPARVATELTRTAFQMRLFAGMLEEGSWVNAYIEHGNPNRTPLPKPDLRSLLRPIGPVAVFGASNFPLAYSVAGGDTASALASGCPVIVKAHAAHPGTSAIVGRIVLEAARECGMPDGVFSLLFDDGFEIGLELVKHPNVKAVGFTGSRRGGRALMDAARARPEPIPVYAEMSSINPLFILPGALEHSAALAQGLSASITQGMGQFCTKPGLVLLPQSEEGEAFLADLTQRLSGTAAGTLLTLGIHAAYGGGVGDLLAAQGVDARVLPPQNEEQPESGGATAHPALFVTTAQHLLDNHALMNEVFGPAALVVRYRDDAELQRVARILEGQLTCSLHGTDAEFASQTDLIAILASKAGRVVFNGFPTGVEVGTAIVHGGPYPSTSDGQSTSVGNRAILRFVRPVCYQNAPEAVLPPELQESNPLNIRRLVDGEWVVLSA